MFNENEIHDAIIKGLVGGIIIIDKSEKVIFVNDGYLQFLEKRRSQVINKHISKILYNTRLPIVLKTEKPEYGSWQWQEDKCLCGHRIPLYNKSGALIGVMGQLFLQDPLELIGLKEKFDNTEAKIAYYHNKIKTLWDKEYSFDSIIGKSINIIKTKKIATKASNTNATILLQGETGVGKEMFAHAIHNLSYRNENPLIRVNSSAIPNELIESELFGYDEGAFTGAKNTGKLGKFELADGGTIFLDEIGEMPKLMQSKILRVLQEREIERVGGLKSKKIDIRIISATNMNLEKLVKQGRFRSDLYYRLRVIQIDIPPLRKRKEDIPELAHEAINRVTYLMDIPPKRISPKALKTLINYDWPGNVRELFNVMERAVILNEGKTIELDDLMLGGSDDTKKPNSIEDAPLKDIMEKFEMETIYSALLKANGNRNLTSDMLGINRITLYKKMKKYNFL